MAAIVRILVYVVMLLVEPVLSKIIGAIGFGFITYAGVGLIFTKIQAAIANQIGYLSQPIFAVLSISGVGQAFTIILSALSIRLYLNGLNSAGNIVRSKWTPKE